MTYNEKTKEVHGHIELPKIGWAERIINNIIWGDSVYNPNKINYDRNKTEV